MPTMVKWIPGGNDAGAVVNLQHLHAVMIVTHPFNSVVMGATIFCWAEHETLFDTAGQWMKTTDKKAGKSARLRIPTIQDLQDHDQKDNTD